MLRETDGTGIVDVSTVKQCEAVALVPEAEGIDKADIRFVVHHHMPAAQAAEERALEAAEPPYMAGQGVSFDSPCNRLAGCR